MSKSSCLDADAVVELHSARGKELVRLSKLSFEEKMKKSKEIIERALSIAKNPFVSCSFGKDSITLLHLVNSFTSVPAYFLDTGVEYPETKEYIERIKELLGVEVFIIKPKYNFFEIVEKYGYPSETRAEWNIPECCRLLKEEPRKEFIREHNVDLDFVGLTYDEGRRRRMTYIMKGDFLYYLQRERVTKCIPLLFWNRDDILQYIKENNIPLHPAYGKYKIERLGCIPCTGHIGWQEQMARISPALYRKISHDMGQMLIEDYER